MSLPLPPRPGWRDLAGRQMACPPPSRKPTPPTNPGTRAEHRSAALIHGRLRCLRNLPQGAAEHARRSTVPPFHGDGQHRPASHPEGGSTHGRDGQPGRGSKNPGCGGQRPSATALLSCGGWLNVRPRRDRVCTADGAPSSSRQGDDGAPLGRHDRGINCRGAGAAGWSTWRTSERTNGLGA